MKKRAKARKVRRRTWSGNRHKRRTTFGKILHRIFAPGFANTMHLGLGVLEDCFERLKLRPPNLGAREIHISLDTLRRLAEGEQDGSEGNDVRQKVCDS